MLKRLKTYWSYVILAALLFDCQKASEQITLPEGNLQSNPELAVLLSNTLAFDGSFDNAIDNSSCFAVHLPVDVVVNGQELTVATQEDILVVEEILNEHPFDFDTIRLSFPVTVTLPDYSEEVLSDQLALNELRANCQEGGLDEDIECVDFNYPLTAYTYDPLNQLASNKQFESDRELFAFMSGLNQVQITTLAFPVTVTLSDGAELEIQDSEQLATVIASNVDTCDENDTQFYNNVIGVPFETGTLRIQLTDAPFPTQLVDEANIVVNSLDIRNDEADTLLNISEELFQINLLELNNGITVSLADVEIPEGVYDEIRMNVTESTVLLTDGTLYDLKVPGEKIKIKIEPGIEIEAEQTLDLLLDFDVSRSFVVQGNPNTPAGIRGFLFKPVVKAVNLANAGALAGTVQDLTNAPLEGAQISVFAADTLNTTSFTNLDGSYRILGLLPGDYEIVAELDGYLANTQPSTIQQGIETILDFQLEEE